MTKTERKLKAQEIIMDTISTAGYRVAEMELSEKEQKALFDELKKQMDRVAKMFGYDEAWFS